MQQSEIFELREYQKEAVENAIDFLENLKEKKAAIEVLPTGSGKSLVIANIAKRLNEPTLVFQPSKEILEQNYNKLLSYGISDCSIYSASMNTKEISNLTYATIGSVRNKKELFKHFKYVIVDECHFVNSKKGMYKEFFDVIGDKMLGLTATPYRLTTDGFGGSILKFLTRTRPSIFKKVVYHIQNKDLFDQGFLAKLIYEVNGGFDSKQLRLNTTGADYTDNSVKEYYSKINFSQKLYEEVLMLYKSRSRKNILVFTRFIEEARNLVNSLGDIAAIVTSETEMKERTSIISRFKSGDIKIIANVGVLTTGFDYPELETIVLARPTRSLALYYQMIGRGIRPHRDKDYSLIVDLCNNHKRFGKIETLKLVEPRKNLWHIENEDKQLTNIYFD